MHKLALKMGRTVSELSPLMPMDELARWMAFDRLSPIGDDRADYFIAQLCAVVCNVAGVKKEPGRAPNPNAFSLEDFLLFTKRQPKIEPKPLDFMRSFLGGRVIKGKPKRKRT
jgi:hypothetical protein